jgi:alanine dehydrogenase
MTTLKKNITVGFPRMLKEHGEKRAFLPDFIQMITHFADVYLSEGYGSRLGYSFDDYRQGNPRVAWVEQSDTFQKDYVIVLRSPSSDEFERLKHGSCLVSMLHYPTRPQRVKKLNELGIHSISLDSIVDDHNLRLVENMRAVAWNGLEVAFDELEKVWPGLQRANGNPFHTLILGAGMIGKHAVEAATKFGNIERNTQQIENGGMGSIALTVGRNLTQNHVVMEALLQQTDILVDATQRRNPSLSVIPNAWVACLPTDAIIVDLAVDPYLLNHKPPVVRGVEGIPRGNLDKYVFKPTDPDWDSTVPATIPSENRRTAVSCYSWPGIHPETCMDHYGRQLTPLMKELLTKGYDGLSLEGGYFERALYRAKLPGAEES